MSILLYKYAYTHIYKNIHVAISMYCMYVPRNRRMTIISVIFGCIKAMTKFNDLKQKKVTISYDSMGYLGGLSDLSLIFDLCLCLIFMVNRSLS